jgi:hypothetical protein
MEEGPNYEEAEAKVIDYVEIYIVPPNTWK